MCNTILKHRIHLTPSQLYNNTITDNRSLTGGIKCFNYLFKHKTKTLGILLNDFNYGTNGVSV